MIGRCAHADAFWIPGWMPTGSPCGTLWVVRPLLLTGPPACGKSTTARAIAGSLRLAAVIDVDDIRQLIVAGHAAPWEGEAGRSQQRLGVENTCDLARRFVTSGIDVVIADVVTPTARIYRADFPTSSSSACASRSSRPPTGPG